MSEERNDITEAPLADLTVESPAVRSRGGEAVVKSVRPGVSFKLERFEGPLDLLLWTT